MHANQTEPNTSTALAALAYAQRLEWPVLPLHGKLPAIPKSEGGRGVHDASLDPETIRAWWRRWPNANIGVAAGQRAGVFVVDLDGDIGEESWDELCREHGQPVETVEQLTGRGRHLLFRWVPGVRNGVGIRPGIDTRSDGGYIVAAPSRHPDTGRLYAWEVDHRPGEVPVASAPDWLLALCRATGGDRKAGKEWLKSSRHVVPIGYRNSVAASVLGHLFRRGVEPVLVATLIQAWNERNCQPPLDEQELARTFESVLRAELRRRNRNET